MTNRRSYWNQLDNYERRIASLWHGPSQAEIVSVVSRHARDGVRADFGCGPGYWLNTLEGGSRIHAVDFSRNMLDQARKRAPEGTVFHQQNLRDLKLQEQIDFALCLNALMPESHTEALRILERLFGSLAREGKIVLIVPSFEAVIYAANAIHFSESMQGREAQSLRQRIDTWCEWFNNPLGYVRNSRETVVKYWLREEAEDVFKLFDHVQIDEYFRPEIAKNATGEMPPSAFQRPWLHGWVLSKAPS